MKSLHLHLHLYLLSICALAAAEPIPNKAKDSCAPCRLVDDVVSLMRKNGAEATTFCSHVLKLPSVTDMKTISLTVTNTNKVTVTAPGPVVTAPAPEVTISDTVAITIASTTTSTAYATVTTPTVITTTITAAVTSYSLVTGTIPAYLTTVNPIKRRKEDCPTPGFLKPHNAAKISAACSCLHLPSVTTITKTASIKQTVTVAAPATITADAVTVTPATVTRTSVQTNYVTTLETQVQVDTVTVASTTTTTVTVTATAGTTITQTQIPNSICDANILSRALVDLGVNDNPPGSSASNNFGPYTAVSCCQLCYNTPGCYFAYIVVTPPQPGVTANNNCFLEYFTGEAPAPGFCPTQYSTTAMGQRTFPAQHYLIPGPCAVVN